MAEKDKVRFQQEMAEYVPPPPEVRLLLLLFIKQRIFEALTCRVAG